MLAYHKIVITDYYSQQAYGDNVGMKLTVVYDGEKRTWLSEDAFENAKLQAHARLVQVAKSLEDSFKYKYSSINDDLDEIILYNYYSIGD